MNLKEYRYLHSSERLQEAIDNAPKPIPPEAVFKVAEVAGPKKTNTFEAVKAGSRATGRTPYTVIADASGTVRDATLRFGKYKGLNISEIRINDPSYLRFLKAERRTASKLDGFPEELIDIVEMHL